MTELLLTVPKQTDVDAIGLCSWRSQRWRQNAAQIALTTPGTAVSAAMRGK